jgi:transcriptional regulator
MHPNRTFHWEDTAEMLAFLESVSFATICVDGPAVVHAPVVVDGAGRLLFHVSRGNAAVRRLDGARAIASFLGPDTYVSPDWYEAKDQVPTWNYVAVEVEGPLRRMEAEELPDLLDSLSALHEERLLPKRPWTRDKMPADRFEAMVKGIIGYELTVETLRGTRKLGQNKSADERVRVADALYQLGRVEVAEFHRPALAAADEGQG